MTPQEAIECLEVRLQQLEEELSPKFGVQNAAEFYQRFAQMDCEDITVEAAHWFNCIELYRRWNEIYALGVKD